MTSIGSDLPFSSESYDLSRGSMTNAQLAHDLHDRLAATPTGRDLVAELDRHGVSIHVVGWNELLRLDGTGDARVEGARSIAVVRDIATGLPLRATASLAHAAARLTDPSAAQPTAAGRFGDLLAGLFLDPLRWRNPVSAVLDRTYEHESIDPELGPARVGATIASELGVLTSGEIGLRSDGSVRSREEIRRALEAAHRPPVFGVRTMLAAPIATIPAAIAGVGVYVGLSRLHAPHPGLVAGLGAAALGTALVVRDRASHRPVYDEHEGPIPDEQLVDRALDVLASTPEGAPIASALRDTDVPIVVYGEQELHDRFGPINGAYYPGRHVLVLSRDQLQDANRAAALLGHEGTHLMDMPARRSFAGIALRALPSALGAAISAPLHLRNPLGAFSASVNDALLESEARAYSTESRLERDLGLDRNAFATREDGSLRTRDEIMDRLRANPHYGLWGGRRLTFDALLGTLGALTGALAIDQVVYRTRHASPTVAIIGACVGSALTLAAFDTAMHWSPPDDDPSIVGRSAADVGKR